MRIRADSDGDGLKDPEDTTVQDEKKGTPGFELAIAGLLAVAYLLMRKV
ncbi:MAG: hypothetical protein ACNYVW_02125 [Methanosarcinales archaeon]